MPTLTPSPEPSLSPTPTPASKQYAIEYYVPLLPDRPGTSYYLDGEDGPYAITLKTGEEGSNSLGEFIIEGRQKRTENVSADQDITESLKTVAMQNVENTGELQGMLRNYGEGATLKCRGWCDDYGNFWSLDSESKQSLESKFQNLAMIKDTLRLYAVYSIIVPAAEPAGQTTEYAVLHLVVNRYEAGEFRDYKQYYIALPSGARIEYMENEEYQLFWESGSGTMLPEKEVTITKEMNTCSLHIEKISD